MLQGDYANRSLFSSVNIICSLGFITICASYFAFVVYMIFFKRSEYYSNSELQMATSELFLETKHSFQDNIYLIIFLSFRTLFIFVLLFLHEYPVTQCMIIIFAQLFVVQYLVIVQPFQAKKKNYMEIYNEGTILVCFGLTLINTPLVEDTDIQYINTLVTIGIILFCVIVNLVFVFKESWDNSKAYRDKIKKCCCRK
mmetsp:Transcript_39350/g.37789  ORF Transcript_39350/g.37789 Transcript_39350/m.37789 type:complete len:198 (+) Transcript_39350:3038-3631(+)